MSPYNLTIELSGNTAYLISNVLTNTIDHIIKQHFAHLKHYFPFTGNGLKSDIMVDNSRFVVLIEETNSQMPIVGIFNKNTDLISDFIEKFPSQLPTPKEIHQNLGNDWVSFNRFSYCGEIVNGKASTSEIQLQIMNWLEEFVLPNIEKMNEQAVNLAIKPSPSYNPNFLTSSLCILECETDLKQGTAFYLQNIGFITCSHSLGTNTKVFFADKLNKKYDIEVIKKHDAIDLAIFNIKGFTSPTIGYLSTSSDEIKQMDHIIISGFPNYQFGDTGVITPGIVTGFRKKSAITRILTNAPIVAGTSGGPVFNSESKVIGVAVTGADSINESHKTEENAIIPISALDLL